MPSGGGWVVDMLKKTHTFLIVARVVGVELLMLFGKLRVSWNLENSNWFVIFWFVIFCWRLVKFLNYDSAVIICWWFRNPARKPTKRMVTKPVVNNGLNCNIKWCRISEPSTVRCGYDSISYIKHIKTSGKQKEWQKINSIFHGLTSGTAVFSRQNVHIGNS